MTQPEPDPEKKPVHKPKRKWLRRLGYGLLGFLLLFAIFHRPLVKTTIRVVAVKVAARQNIDLSLEVGGTVLTSLSLENVRARPSGGGASPVEEIDIELVRVEFSIPSLIRHGFREFLESYELRNASIEVRPVAGTPSQKRDLGDTLSGILQQPALFSDRVDVNNLNLVAHSDDGQFAMRGLSIFLHPVKQGHVRFERLEIPNFRTWENVNATATYANRDLIVQGLVLDSELQITRFQLDASKRAENKNQMNVKGLFFGGQVEYSLFVHQLEENKAEAKTTLSVTSLSLDRLGAYINAPLSGELTDLTMHLYGDPNAPNTWDGDVTALASSISSGPVKIDQLRARMILKDGMVTIGPNRIESGENHLTFEAKCSLPKSAGDLLASDVDAQLQISVTNLAQIVPEFTGTILASGPLQMRNRVLTSELSGTAKNIQSPKVELASAAFNVELTKILPEPPPENKPTQQHEQETSPFDGLKSRVAATFQEARFDAYAMDSGTLTAAQENAAVWIEHLAIQRGENAISLSGSYRLPRDMKSWEIAPLDAAFEINAPRLSEFSVEPSLTGFNGQLKSAGRISSREGVYNGFIQLDGSDLRYGEFNAGQLTLDIGIEQSLATIKTLRLALNERDFISGTGTVELKKPFIYEGAMQVNIADLAVLNPAFAAANSKLNIGGSLSVDWKGSGKAELIQHSGELQLKLSKGRVNELLLNEVEIAGLYSPEVINIPTFHLNTSQGDLRTTITLQNSVLELKDLVFQQSKAAQLSGSIALPLDLRTPKNPETIIPPDGPVAVNLSTKDLNLATLLQKPGKPAPVRGTLSSSLTASGTLSQLVANLQVSGRNLQAAATEKLAPASLDLELSLANERLALSGTVKQPSINPLQISGSLPFPVQQIIKNRKIDEQSPVEISVRLPRSSMAFLSQITPAIRYVEGTAAIDANVSGTIANPELSGSAQLDLAAIRMREETSPAINDFKGDIRFAENRLTFTRFGGDLSGGTFGLTGSIDLVKLNEPVLDLRLQSSNALLVRNDTITVRADSDISVAGPLNAANVTGSVGITKSKFIREIEILPIELPGRPAPKPPAAASTGISFPNPPLRDWTFNVAIKTKDPFLIRGNLANGMAIVDLRLVGTGKNPALDGMVRIENFEASLPFSTLQVNYGYIYFTPDNPFVPTLDIQGTSTMRDYNINVYIFGTASDPQTVFSSEPPLPQEDIIALLATGTTTEELTGSGDVLAGRATVLAFQSLYRKVFKKREPSEKETFMDRFDVDVGTVDPRTGRQELTTRFKLSERFYLVGEVDVQGDVRGQVKYLLRFR